MAKDKYDFIQDILTNKRLTPSQKERVLKLTKSEIEKDRTLGKDLEERVLKLENKNDEVTLFRNNIEIDDDCKDNIGNGLASNSENDTNNELLESFKKKFKDPFSNNGLTKFLLEFNNDPVLKYAWHNVETEDALMRINASCESNKYDIIKHQNILEKRLAKLLNKYFISPQIKAIFLGFITGQDYGKTKYVPWSNDNIRINWKANSLLLWCDSNPGIPPHIAAPLARNLKSKGFKFDEKIVLKSTIDPLIYFSNLIIHFKHMFKIRSVNNPLRPLIENYNREFNNELVNISFTNNFYDNIDLFTVVDKLLECYKKVINIIIEICEEKKLGRPEVKLSFFENEYDNSIEFIIHHKNVPFYGKTPYQTKNRIGEKQKILIEDQINGLCYLIIRAKFENSGSYEINLWDNRVPRYSKIEDLEGVQYILKFKQ